MKTFRNLRFNHSPISEISRFLTKKYQTYDPNRIVSKHINEEKLYKIDVNPTQKTFRLMG
jgi:hypothetical protein